MAEAKWKRKLRKDIAADQRKEARAELRDLRAGVKKAKQRRTRARALQVKRCKVARVRVRERIKIKRELVRAQLKEEIDEMRTAARNRCTARKFRISKSRDTAQEKAVAKLAEAKALTRLLEGVGRRQRAGKKRITAAERKSESDDAVMHNLPADLKPIFTKMRRHIKGGPRRSRTEEFFEWVQENPGEVLHMRGDRAELDAARLIREHELAERRAYDKTRLAAVPF